MLLSFIFHSLNCKLCGFLVTQRKIHKLPSSLFTWVNIFNIKSKYCNHWSLDTYNGKQVWVNIALLSSQVFIFQHGRSKYLLC